MIISTVAHCPRQAGLPCISPVTVRFKRSAEEALLAKCRKFKRVYVCNDNEDSGAGNAGALATIRRLAEGGIYAYVIELPVPLGQSKIDLCEYLRDNKVEDFRELMGTADHAVVAVAKTIGTTLHEIERIKESREVLGWIAKMDKAEQAYHLRATAKILGVGVAVLREMFKAIEQGQRGKDKGDAIATAPQMTDTSIDQARLFFNPGRTTQVGNAERLREQCGEDIRYVEEWDWMAWNGSKWSIDRAVIESLYKETARGIYHEAAEEEDKYLREELWKWAKKSESHAVMAGSLRMAESEPGIPTKTDQFDCDLWALNCPGGTVDLQSGEERHHEKADLITKQIPIAYDPDAECPTFDAFLKRIMNDDAGMVEFIQRAVGYSLTGSTREQCLFILHGGGQNGKSTLINVLMDLLGEYAQHTPTDALMMKRGDQGIPNDLARLAGARMEDQRNDRWGPARGALPAQGVVRVQATIQAMAGDESQAGDQRHRPCNLATNQADPLRCDDHRGRKRSRPGRQAARRVARRASLGSRGMPEVASRGASTA